MDHKTNVERKFKAVEKELQDLSRWLYENPETAFQEHKSSARLTAYLGDNGFDVEYPAYGLDTAFVARAGSSGPEVIICAEYDALPGVGQACGHNIIAAAAAGAGAALAPLVDELGLRLTVLGTPGEEHYGGKVDLINAGAFANAAAAMMIHPSDHNTVDPVFLANKHLDLEFRGQAAHASASPWEGVNALDAAVQAYINISTLRQSMYPTDKIHGIITHGGDAPNIIPDYTKMVWYIRALTSERLEELQQRVFASFESAATASGCTIEITNSGHPYTDMRNDSVMVELFAKNSAAVGRPMGRAADRDDAGAGSTDMANVSQIVPTIHPMLDMNCYPAVNHQREFAAATITPGGETCIRDGALAMAWTIVDLAVGNHWGELGR